ncbi:ureidoglycolate hydrolase [Patellaria atrata CBS 101060]|uniref:Ureidoglycolate hydrolase n=1 Tax=Patellaria atrata CBS 101060 TaxID=1346257 RepID=A0A9P4VR52_9PEZI|nr:ureidoglycolate hydrolase [Patellaria atrata CBS 101060]
MASSITSPSRQIPIEPLSQEAFSSFGTVIENPSHAQSSQSHLPPVIPANQGTALKYLDVTHMTNYYHLASSKRAAKAVMNMFVCSPRPLRAATSPLDSDAFIDDYLGMEDENQVFDVKILERHPFTSQTFIPLGVSPTNKSAQYLVIVAPTLPTKHIDRESGTRPPPYPLPQRRRKRSITDIFSRARPSPFTNERAPPTGQGSGDGMLSPPKGRGLPDLSGIRAFLANGNQAVTYGAGTWHAPMVVLGNESIDFVVVQFANGVGHEDCQEVELKGDGPDGESISVVIQRDWGGIMVSNQLLKPKL